MWSCCVCGPFFPVAEKGARFFCFMFCLFCVRFFVFVLWFLFEWKKKRWESVRRLKVVRKRGKDWKKICIENKDWEKGTRFLCRRKGGSFWRTCGGDGVFIVDCLVLFYLVVGRWVPVWQARHVWASQTVLWATQREKAKGRNKKKGESFIYFVWRVQGWNLH